MQTGQIIQNCIFKNANRGNWSDDAKIKYPNLTNFKN